MKLFSTQGDNVSMRFFGTKGEAMKAARELAPAYNEPITVTEHELVPGKAGIVALANGPGWCASDNVLKVVKPRKAAKAADPWE